MKDFSGEWPLLPNEEAHRLLRTLEEVVEYSPTQQTIRHALRRAFFEGVYHERENE